MINLDILKVILQKMANFKDDSNLVRKLLNSV